MGTETTSGLRSASVVAEQKSTGLLATHTDALKTHSSQRFLRNYWNPRKLTANIYCKSTIIPLCLLWICSSNMKSFSDNSFSGICGKELHFLLDLTLSNEKLRYTCNSFCQILHKALLLEEIARIFLQNMQRFFTFKPIYVALRPSNTLVLQDLLSSRLCHASQHATKCTEK